MDNYKDVVSLVEDLESATKNTADTMTAHFDAFLNLENYKFELKKKEGELLLSGEINGKNAETRDAQMQSFLLDDYMQLRVLEEMERRANLQKQIAELDLSRIKSIIRVVGMEVAFMSLQKLEDEELSQ